jgi:hypothetical protein
MGDLRKKNNRKVVAILMSMIGFILIGTSNYYGFLTGFSVIVGAALLFGGTALYFS